jgi:hypothetical protein
VIRILGWGVIAVGLTACANTGEVLPTVAPVATAAAPAPCMPPKTLVRDLTVLWAQRSYVVAPCPETTSRPSVWP